MNLRDHARARLAFEHLNKVKQRGDDVFVQKYGSMAHKLPILLHSAGVAPALHFVAARSHPGQREILAHLAQQLVDAELLEGGNTAANLLKVCREADFEKTRMIGRELQRVLLWYKRFTQSELKIDSVEDETP